MKTRDMALKIAGYASMAVFAFAAVSCGTKKSVVPEHTAETVRPAEVAKKATANIFDGINAERRINIEAGGLTLGGIFRQLERTLRHIPDAPHSQIRYGGRPDMRAPPVRIVRKQFFRRIRRRFIYVFIEGCIERLRQIRFRGQTYIQDSAANAYITG